jgi:hypothetical protein
LSSLITAALAAADLHSASDILQVAAVLLEMAKPPASRDAGKGKRLAISHSSLSSIRAQVRLASET